MLNVGMHFDVIIQNKNKIIIKILTWKSFRTCKKK